MVGKVILISSFGLAVFIVCTYLKKKKKLRFSPESFSYVGFTFFLGLIIYVLIAVGYGFTKNMYPERNFTRTEWLDNKEKRYEIYQDLSKNKCELFLNSSKEKVIHNLGTPQFSNDSLFYYYLGITPGLFALDPEYLIIEFSDKERSRSFSIKRFS